MTELPADSIGGRIRAQREAEGISLTELAERSGISKSYLSNLENKPAHQKPSAETLYDIARALGTSMSALLGRGLLIEPSEESADLDPVLRDFAAQAKLTDGELRTLSSINWRGAPPQTVDRWRFVYNAITASKTLD